MGLCREERGWMRIIGLRYRGVGAIGRMIPGYE
jgi:hypothetical protein